MITIADVSSWLSLVTTIVNGLSFRAIVSPGILITSTGEVTTADHLDYLRKVEIGAEEVIVLEGDHPIDALLNLPEMIKWLVENHLIMSTTAQRKDISDPDVIAEFAEHVGDQNHLDHIYLLTVADIRATSPSLWNSWKDALLAELYHATSRALRRGLDNPLKHQELAKETQAEAMVILANSRLDKESISEQWQQFTQDYLHNVTVQFF